MRIEYDKAGDVLYLTLEECAPDACIFRENGNGDVLRISRDTGEIVGVTIIAFLLRIEKGYEIEVSEIGAVPFKKLASRFAGRRSA
jgi:uncharacterized protein YuzE